MTDYTPQVGSMVDKLLRHLVQAGPGQHFTAVELEAATGVNNSTVQPSLWSPIRRGFVEQVKRPGPPARNAWGITADGMAALCGEPEPAANGAPEEDGSHDGSNVEHDSVRPVVSDLCAQMKEAGAGGWAPSAEPPAEASFACALYSDGRFHIETSEGESFTLQKGDTRQLLAYLDLLRTGESGAVAEDQRPAPSAQ